MTSLALTAARGRMRKISNNVLGEDAENNRFTFPVEGVALTADMLDAILGPYTFRSWYNQRSGDGLWEPMTWWEARKHGDYPIDDEFVYERAVIVVAGDQELAFEPPERNEDDDSEDEEDDLPAAKITNIVFKPTPGGVTLLSFHLQVHPGLGRENQLLQAQQYHDIIVTVENPAKAKAAKKRDQAAAGQGELALPTPGTEPSQGESERQVSGGYVPDKTGAQIDEEMRARARPPKTIYQDSEAGREAAAADGVDFDSLPIENGVRVHLAQPDATNGHAGETEEPSDATNGAESATAGGNAETPEDLSEFEEGARRQVAAATARPGDVIDGTSELSRARARRGAH